MTKEYELTSWPKRIRIEQDKFGAMNLDIFDADTGEKLTLVLQITISHKDGTMVYLTQSKYKPVKPALEADEREASEPYFEEYDGVITETRGYPINRLTCEAGL